MKRTLAIASLLAWLGWAPLAPAQATNAASVSSCGLASLTVGLFYPVEIDTTGRLCTSFTGTVTVQGAAATGSSVSGNPLLDGGRAATALPTAVTDGQAAPLMITKYGALVDKLYSPPDLDLQGYASTTGGLATTIIAAQGGSLKTKIVAVQCYNTSATTITVAFTDSASTTIVVPAGSGNNPVYPIPLSTAANTAFQFTASTGETTIGCAAQGYASL